LEIIRAVRLNDLDQLWELIKQSTYGLTTLQINKDQLADRVELSNFAFTRKVERPSGEPYVMVMEDSSTSTLVGLSCIFGKTGGYEPFYSYRRVVETQYCEHLDIRKDVEVLMLDKLHDGPTELGSLFLLPEYRGQGRGRLLSLSRFTFMTMHPKRFSDRVIAEMRGVSTEEGQSPFWDAILQHFFGMQFLQADRLSTISKRFIEDLMPRHPIYTCLLSEETRSVMGQVHRNTRPALAMLESEGFRKTDCIDIFDGGPLVSCKREHIDAIKRTIVGRVIRIAPTPASPPTILASMSEGFRAMLGSVEMVDEGFVINEAIASALQVTIHDEIRSTALHPHVASSKVSPL
jgi:arginine N-succinyltransferase